MSEYILENKTEAPNKLPVIETVKRGWKTAFVFISTNLVLFGLLIASHFTPHFLLNGVGLSIFENIFSLKSLILTVFGVSVTSLLVVAISNFSLNHAFNLQEFVKYKSFWNVFIVLMVFAIISILGGYLSNPTGGVAYLGTAVNFIMIYLGFKIAPYYAAQSTNFQPELTLGKAFELTKGNFWRITGIFILIALPSIVLNLIKFYFFGIEATNLFIISLVSLILALTTLAHYSAYAYVFKHLSEKAHA